MQIQLLSDVHLEAHPNWRGVPAPGADLLVLAGDIGSYQPGSAISDGDFGLGQFSPHNGWPTPVMFVPGNHEYDGMDFDIAHDRLRETCARLGLLWLERETMVFGGVRFIGTTLWSDFDALAPAPDPQPAPKGRHGAHPTKNLLAQQLKAREKAYRAANFYLSKTETTRQGAPWLAEGMREQALVCQDWLRAALAQPFDGTTVAITHFAPSLLSADPRYGLSPGTAGFCNALDDLLPHAQLWLHGHLHAPSDYVHRGCHVVANPLGYARKNEQTQFKPTGLIEIGM